MSTQKRTGDYHVSSHLKGTWKDGAWHCAHGYRAWEDKAGPNSNYYMMRCKSIFPHTHKRSN
jgi:hypothetical protein